MDSIAQLQEIIERGRQATEERKRQDELDAIARQKEEERKRQDRLRKSGLAEWMIEHLSVEYDQNRWWYTLALPGCSPIIFMSFAYRDGTYSYDDVGVRTPTELHYDQDADLWIVRYSYEHLPRLDNLDEAIALAADLGESWHAMKAEAERRNAEGLRPQPPTPAQPEPKPEPDDDVLDSAGMILRNYTNGQTIGGLEFQDDRQSTVVIASMLLAIAVELRRINNTLNDIQEAINE